MFRRLAFAAGAALFVLALIAPKVQGCVSCMVDEDLGINTCIQDLTTGWESCAYIFGFLPCEDFDPGCEEWGDLLLADGTLAGRDVGDVATRSL